MTTGGCGYHNDGIGMLNPDTESYATVDHNTIEFRREHQPDRLAERNLQPLQNTNNLLSGDNVMYAGGRCTSACSPPTYITTTGNTLNTYLAFSQPGGGAPLDTATNFWSGTGDVWNHNYWAVPPGAAWGTPAYNGYYWVPTSNSQTPQDCGFVSRTDYPNANTPCK